MGGAAGRQNHVKLPKRLEIHALERSKAAEGHPRHGMICVTCPVWRGADLLAVRCALERILFRICPGRIALYIRQMHALSLPDMNEAERRLRRPCLKNKRIN